jgi:hypothetical protein
MIKWVIIFFICLITDCLPQSNQFFLFDETNSPLNVNNLGSLAIDSTNNIWIGGYSFLYKYNSGNWFSKDSLLELQTTPGYILDIEVESNGNLWFCKFYNEFTNYHTLYSYEDGWVDYLLAVGSGSISASKLFIDETDLLWVTFYNNWPHQLGDDLIGKFDGEEWVIYERKHLSGAGDLVTKDDSIYVITWEGLYKGKDGDWLLINPDDWLPAHIWGYNKQIFVSGPKKLSLFDGSQYTAISEIDTFLSSTLSNVTCVNYDKDSILWIGTDNGYILQFKDSLRVITQFSGKAIAEIEIDIYNNKWILIPEVGLLIYNEEGIQDINESYPLPLSHNLLSQNYPNPFNPLTIIRYEIPEVSFVTLKVNDVLGNQIATLVNEELPAGEYEATFDGTGLPSGIYFYQLQIGGPETSSGQTSIQTRKMVLLK